jgi:ectoine hydroxylase-related dioxygenase (phytanoyl-CoA dioxygenase family)
MLEEREARTTATLARVRFGAPVDEVMAIYRRDGGLVLEDVLSEAEVAALNADLDAAFEALHCGTIKDDADAKAFWGERTKRLTNAVTLSQTYRTGIVDNDTTMGYVTEIYRGVSDTLWLNSSQAIEIHPGETAQPLHRDMANYPIFFRYGPAAPEVMVNLLVALSDCVEAAGATRIIPGSHTWELTERGAPEMTIPAELKPGSALLFSGKVIHGGGANTTTDVKRRVVIAAFNPGFLVPEEAYPFVVPLELVREMSPRLQQLIGFRSFHQKKPRGGSLWQHNYEELALHLGL